MDPMTRERLRRREAVAEELDKTIDTLGKLYEDLTIINSVTSGNRKFDKVETDRRVRARIMSAVKIFGVPKDLHLAGSIAAEVRKDHAELAAKKGA